MKFLFLLLFISSVCFGSATTLRQIDNIQNSTGGSSLAVPGTGSTFATDTNTLTLTGKTMSGASNTFTNISAGSISSGILTVPNGGTGDSTLTLNGMLFGNGTSAVGITAAGSQYQVFQAGASGVPTIDAVHLDQAAATSGQLGVAKGGTGASSLTVHGVVIGNSTSAVNVTSAGTSGQVLTSNGASADPTFQTFVSGTPSLNGGSGSPESITAGGGVTLTSIVYNNYVWVVGNGGAVTVTATPSITACTADGQTLHVIGTSASNTVTLQDEANLSGSKLRLNGNVTLGLYNSIQLHCDITLGMWVEDSRSN